MNLVTFFCVCVLPLQVPEAEMDPSCLMKKDAAPSTIYEIFSNNVSTFNPDSPTNKQPGDYNPFSPDTSNFENGDPMNGAPVKQNYAQVSYTIP